MNDIKYEPLSAGFKANNGEAIELDHMEEDMERYLWTSPTQKKFASIANTITKRHLPRCSDGLMNV
jgi:hypothetical protein